MAVDESLTTFLFELANFLALAAMLAWLFFKPVRAALESQRATAKGQAEQAAQKLAEAERMRGEIDLQRKALGVELEAMRTKQHEIAKQEAAQLVAEAKAQIERERAVLMREAVQMDTVQSAKIAQAVASVTHAALKRLFQQIEGPDLERSLISAACRELKAFSNTSLAPVTVETPESLDDELRQAIESSLGSSRKTATFRVAPELGSGIRIATAHGLIDASVAGLADFAEQSLKVEMESLMREEPPNE